VPVHQLAQAAVRVPHGGLNGSNLNQVASKVLYKQKSV
jgi:hypothetical protein